MKETPWFKVRRRFRVWILGLIGGVLGGMATAANAWLTQLTLHERGYDVLRFDLDQLMTIAWAGGLASGTAFLMRSPRPSPKDDTEFMTKFMKKPK